MEEGDIKVEKLQLVVFHFLTAVISLRNLQTNAYILIFNPFCGKTK